MKFLNKELLNLVKSQFKLDIKGLHGVEHWERVYENTQTLAKHYDIKSDVFELFALLHDSKREDEYTDIKHGKRAAIYVKELITNNTIKIATEDKKRLLFACSNHTKSNKKAKLYEDLVVQICLDADRLDIGRVGLEPEEKYFNTDYAKKIVREQI